MELDDDKRGLCVTKMEGEGADGLFAGTRIGPAMGCLRCVRGVDGWAETYPVQPGRSNSLFYLILFLFLFPIFSFQPVK
jgi:hypothetical protein